MHVDFEERLGVMLRHTADTFAPDDPLSLVATGHARGRRMHRRRTVGAVAGAAALAVLVAGGVAAGTALSHEDGSPRVPATPSGVTPTITEPDFTTVSSMTETLVPLLPQSARVKSSSGREAGHGLGPDVGTELMMGKGRVEVEVAIGRAAGEAFACPPGASPDRCKIREVNGGRLLLTMDDSSTIGRRPPGQGWVLALYKKGDHIVAVAQYHLAESGFPDTRTPFGDPMLNEAQITRVATAGAWKAVADALPVKADLKFRPPGGAETRESTPR